MSKKYSYIVVVKEVIAVPYSVVARSPKEAIKKLEKRYKKEKNPKRWDYEDIYPFFDDLDDISEPIKVYPVGTWKIENRFEYEKS